MERVPVWKRKKGPEIGFTISMYFTLLKHTL